jgi:hypothetical protein
MKPIDPTTYCLCCGRERPASDFYAGAVACSMCLTRPASEIVTLTRETVRREYAIAAYTKDGRKRARIEAKLGVYMVSGKRCTACHTPKPPEAFNKCAPAPDGLQPICRSCNETRVAVMRSGGLKAWHVVRDALRAQSTMGR